MKRLMLLALALFAGAAVARGPQGTINGPAANGAFPAGDTQPVSFAIAVDAKKATCSTFLLTGGVQGRCDMTPLFADGFVLHGSVTTTGKTNETTTVPYDILVSPPFNCTPSSKTATACSVIIQSRALVSAPPVVVPPPAEPPPVIAPPPEPVTYTWNYIGTERTPFTLTTTRTVRFGVDPVWVEKSLEAGAYLCAVDVFTDPLPGQGKRCWLRVP